MALVGWLIGWFGRLRDIDDDDGSHYSCFSCLTTSLAPLSDASSLSRSLAGSSRLMS